MHQNKTKPQICGIVASGRDFLLGFNSAQKYDLPWAAGAMADDMKFFRKTTAGRVLLMGRKTALGIGRLLPGRLSLVLSRKPSLHLGGMELERPNGLASAGLPSPGETAGFLLPCWDALLEFLIQAMAAYGPPAYLIGGAEMLEGALQRGLLKELFFTFVDAAADTPVEGKPVYLPSRLRTWIQQKLPTEKPILTIRENKNNLHQARIYYLKEIPKNL